MPKMHSNSFRSWLAIALVAAMPFCAARGARTVVFPSPGPGAFADAESATNVVFDTGSVRDDKWVMTFELDADDVSNAQVEFGVDADGDGVLCAHERELSVGWDCGEWVIRDGEGRFLQRVAASSPRRRLEWTLRLDGRGRGRRLESNVFADKDAGRLFNRAWNAARVVVRGGGAALGNIRSVISTEPFVLRII